MTIILIFCFVNIKIDNTFQKKIAKTLVFLLILGVFLQIYQLIYFPKFWGINFMGLNLRNPGLFSIPSTMAFFTLVVMYYAYVFLNGGFFRNSIIYFFVPISILLTASGTGLVAMAVSYAMILYNKLKDKNLKILFLLVLLVTICFVSTNLNQLSGREDIYHSVAVRLNIFSSFLNELIQAPIKIFISNEFGVGTNTEVLISNTLGLKLNNIIVDSTITSILANTGFISTILFIIILLRLFFINFASRFFITIYILFSLTTIIFETFPMNLIFALNIAYFWNKIREIKYEHRA